MKEAYGKTKQNNKTNKQKNSCCHCVLTWRAEGGFRVGGHILYFQFYSVPSAQSLHFTFDIKKGFMKQDKITYDYMKHNCDKSQNYTY